MKVTVFALLCAFLSLPAQSKETWETCLDQADFNFNADTFLKTYRVSKSGCVMTFVEVSGKGTKLRLNLCDPNINVSEAEAIDSETYAKHFAGSSGCPAPLFGADFGVAVKGGVDFGADKAKVMQIFAAIKKVYGPNLSAKDAAKIGGALTSEDKVACGQLLLESYLDDCSAFEAKREEPKSKNSGDHSKK